MSYSANTMIDRNMDPDGDIDVVTLDEYLNDLTRGFGISTPTAESISEETLKCLLDEFGGEIVDVTYVDAPANLAAIGVMTGRYHHIENGKYKSEPIIRPYTDEERADVLESNLRNLRSMTDMFVSRALDTPAIVDVSGRNVEIQLRDSDRINLLGLLMLARGFITDGQNDMVTMEFRTASDETIMLKPSEMVSLTSSVLVRYTEVKGYGWDIKDNLKTVTDLGDLIAIRDHFNEMVAGNVDLLQLSNDVKALLS